MTTYDKQFLAALRIWLESPSDASRGVREYFKDGVKRLEASDKKQPWRKNGTDNHTNHTEAK